MQPSAQHKIGYLVAGFPAPSETFIVNEIEAISQRGFSVQVFSLSSEPMLAIHQLARKWGERASYAPVALSPRVGLAHAYLIRRHPRRYLRALLHYREFGGKQDFLKAGYYARLLEQQQIGHVHAHFGWCAGPAMLMAFLTGGSFSFTLHGSDIFVVPPPNMAQLINASRFCVTISEFNRRYVLQQWAAVDADKLKVIRCGIDPGKFVPPAERSAERERDRRTARLISVGRLCDQKDFPFGLAICERLLRKGFRPLYTIAGDGTERANLEEQVRRQGLGDWVTFTGLVSQEDLIPLYQTSDVFVLTSKSEGIPVVAMEAMAAGLPVVAPRITGVPELVEGGHSGLLFSPGDLEGATEAVASLVEDRALRVRMGARGREKVISEYNIYTNAGQLAKLFQGALTRRESCCTSRS